MRGLSIDFVEDIVRKVKMFVQTNVSRKVKIIYQQDFAYMKIIDCVKSVLVRSFSGSYFPHIRTDYRSEKLRIRTLSTQC